MKFSIIYGIIKAEKKKEKFLPPTSGGVLKEKKMTLNLFADLTCCLGAIKWSNYIVDGIVLLVIVGFAIYCGRRGFVDCFFSFASTSVSIIAAIALAKVVMEVSGGLFGLEGWLSGVFENSFAKLEGFTAEVGAEGTKDALLAQNMPAVIIQLVLDLANSDYAAGTTIAMVLGDVTSSLTCLLVTGLILFTLCKLLLLLTRRLLDKLMDRVEMLETLNIVLGVLIGVGGCLLVVCTILSILAIIPFEPIDNYLNNSLFLKLLYNHNPLVWMLGLLI